MRPRNIQEYFEDTDPKRKAERHARLNLDKLATPPKNLDAPKPKSTGRKNPFQ